MWCWVTVPTCPVFRASCTSLVRINAEVVQACWKPLQCHLQGFSILHSSWNPSLSLFVCGTWPRMASRCRLCRFHLLWTAGQTNDASLGFKWNWTPSTWEGLLLQHWMTFSGRSCVLVTSMDETTTRGNIPTLHEELWGFSEGTYSQVMI